MMPDDFIPTDWLTTAEAAEGAGGEGEERG